VAVAILVSAIGAETPVWVAVGASGSGAAEGSPSISMIGDQTSNEVTQRWTVAAVGDSVMVSAIPGLGHEAQARRWRLIGAAFDGCPVGYEPLYDSRGKPSPFNNSCKALRAAHDAVIAAHPDVIIWHDLQSVLARRSANGLLLTPGSVGWTNDLVAEWKVVLDRFLGAGAEVVIVLPPQRSQDTSGCAQSVRPDRCRDIQQQDQLIRKATMTLWSQVQAWPGVHLVELDSLLCPGGYPCPRLVDGTEVRHSGWDQTHFTPAGAEWFAPRLLDKAMATIGHQRESP
jgi:hypothetical protein